MDVLINPTSSMLILITQNVTWVLKAVWDAKVAFDRTPADLQYRAIMMTAPALGEFTREVDKFYESKNSKTPKCDLTFTARKKLIMVVDNEA
eukprot:5997984-Ditylum_brightwellii.AAC.1